MKQVRSLEEITNEGLVILDFWAPWCEPCKAMHPTLEEVEKENRGVNFLKVDVSTDANIASKYRVMSVPTILALKDGQIIDRIIGQQQKAALQDFVNDNQ